MTCMIFGRSDGKVRCPAHYHRTGHSKTTWPRCGSLDHLVGKRKQRRWNCEVEHPRRLEIEHELEFGWLLNRQIAGFCALQDLVDEQPLSTEHVIIVGGVGHQSSCPHVL